MNNFRTLQKEFRRTTALPTQEQSCFSRDLEGTDPSLAEELLELPAFSAKDTKSLDEVCNKHRVVLGADLNGAESTLPEVGGYAVERHLGEGGQAQVFLAHQLSTGQAVAIKVFRGQGISESQRSRIQQETEALVRLQLPNVVPILDRCETACGRECLITRFIPGRPVDEVAAEWREQDPRRVVVLFVKIAQTLAKVHQAGLIHRDLKPSNVLVDESGEPYLLDFGLASFFADPGGRLLTASFPAGFEGSLRWASPEQVDTSYGRIDHRSDLYSLGVMLYEALSGRFPYAASGGILKVAQQIVRAQPLPLPSCERESMSLSADIAAIVQQLLEKRPARRFQSAKELIEALQSSQTEMAGAAVPVIRKSILWRWGVPTAAVVLLAAVVWGGRPPAPPSFVVPTEQPDSFLAVTDRLSTPTHTAQPAAPVEKLDEVLAPFGFTPEGWRQISSLQHDNHAIERNGLAIQGDFRLRLNLAAAHTDEVQIVLTLVGRGAANDLKITAHKTNTWSDNEEWRFQTPAGPTSANLPIGDHVLTLDRVGERMTLSADGVAGSGDTRLATFAIDADARFQAVRLASSGPALKLGRLRLHSLHDVQP
jgi:serine/threonine protein kinase